MSEKVDYAALKRGGFMRQRDKGCFSLRLHTVGGALSADELRSIAELSERYGAGRAHLTARQGVEIPFVKLEDVEAIRQALAERDMSTGVCGPRTRTVTACQGNKVCPSANIDTQDLAAKVDKRYYGVELPHKFKFGCTGCHNNCLKAEENDIGIKGSCRVTWLEDPCISCGICVKACREGCMEMDDEGKISIDYDRCTCCGRCQRVCPVGAWETSEAYTVYFGGQFGSELIEGKQDVPVVDTEEEVFALADAAIAYFSEHGKAGERFGKLLQRTGREDFDRKLREAYDG